MTSLWEDLGVLFDKRIEEKEMMINQQAEELIAARLKVSLSKGLQGSTTMRNFENGAASNAFVRTLMLN